MNGTYCLTFPNGKRYVGKGVAKTGRGIEVRWNSYMKLYCTDQPKLYNALKLHGSKNVKYEVILRTSDDARAKALEKQLIALWNLCDDKYGYNMTEGGDGSTGYAHNEESRRRIKLSKSNTSEETRRRMSDSAKSRIAKYGHNRLNKKHTKESINKMRESHSKRLSLL